MLERLRNTLPRPARLFLLLVAADLLLFTLLRVAFHLSFAPADDPLAPATLITAFRLGLQFDLRLAVLAALPLLLLGGVRALSPLASPGARRVWSALLAGTQVLLLFVYLVDFGYYAYTASRLNVRVIEFLGNPLISLRMVWESYPVLWGALALALAAWAAFRGAEALLLLGSVVPPARAGRSARIAASVAVGLVAAAGLYGKPSRYPLRWSDAYFSTRTYASDLALNPVLYLAETIRKTPESYDLAAVRAAYPRVARLLGVERPDAGRLVYARRRPPRRRPARPPNLVIVLLESFAAYKTGAFGNPLDPTARFDALAREGALFTRFYTPTWGTARSVFATVTGLPDVETHQTATRNPLIVSQNTILSDFAGYEKYYFLGGSLNWANIRGLLSHNVRGLRIFEEGSYRAAPVDVWGISDLDLFREAVPALSAGGEPFVAIVQTSGSHRPYTIPPDRGGFEPRGIADAEAERHGFVSAAEYEAFRFLDHALGTFVDLAAREPWFANTIFAFYGDHGLPAAAPHIPPADVELQLTKFHVPLLLWGPGLPGGARRVDTVASELDVLPTLASLAGVTATNGGLGRDLLDPAFDGERFAFTIGNQSRPEIGLVGPDRAFRLNADGSRRLVALDGGDPRRDLAASEPRVARRMERLCRALYETARYLAYANTPELVREQLAPPGERISPSRAGAPRAAPAPRRAPRRGRSRRGTPAPRAGSGGRRARCRGGREDRG